MPQVRCVPIVYRLANRASVRNRVWAWPAVFCALLASCGGSPAPRDELSGPQGVEATPAGWLGGVVVTYDDVGRYLRVRDPHAFAANLEGVLMSRIVRAEAKRLGVTVPALTLGDSMDAE